jgi:hypothetical protein
MLNPKLNGEIRNIPDSGNVAYTYYENYKTYQEAMIERREAVIQSMENQEHIDSKVKIVKLLELEFEDLEKQQSALVYSNEVMFQSDPNDLDIIESRAENMKYIKLNFERMKQIYDEISKLDSNNQILWKSIFSLNIDYKKNEEKPESLANGSPEIKYSVDNTQLSNLIEINNSLSENEKSEKVIVELEL